MAVRCWGAASGLLAVSCTAAGFRCGAVVVTGCRCCRGAFLLLVGCCSAGCCCGSVAACVGLVLPAVVLLACALAVAASAARCSCGCGASVLFPSGWGVSSGVGLWLSLVVGCSGVVRLPAVGAVAVPAAVGFCGFCGASGVGAGGVCGGCFASVGSLLAVAVLLVLLWSVGVPAVLVSVAGGGCGASVLWSAAGAVGWLFSAGWLWLSVFVFCFAFCFSETETKESKK